jgi:hypothetical protein
MISAQYLRNQATICLQLARSTLDQHVAARLTEMADFTAKADELDAVQCFDLPPRFSSNNGVSQAKEISRTRSW